MGVITNLSHVQALRIKMTDKENIVPSVDCDDDFRPPKKKVVNSKRFAAATTESEVREIVKGYTPANTKRNTNWALTVFGDWRAARSSESEECCPSDLFENPIVEEINKWIPRFLMEVRKQDGQCYPPRSLHRLLSALQRQMLELNYLAPKFLDRSKTEFRPIHGACNSVFHKLHSEGIGTSRHHTPIITDEEEEQLWSTGVFGQENPKQLQRTVFYYIGKRFCVRGAEEMRKLGPSQFKRTLDPDCITYIEHGSKNNAGRASDLRHENKQVPAPAVGGPRCIVSLLGFYLSKLPLYAFQKDVLFLRPKKTASKDEGCAWYENVPTGKNTLATMVKSLCEDGGLPGKTNHSLRASGATAMFQNNIPERVIQKVTGHRSLESLRAYERISVDQHTEVSKVLMSSATSGGSSVADNSTSSDLPGGLVFNGCSIGKINIHVRKHD